MKAPAAPRGATSADWTHRNGEEQETGSCSDKSGGDSLTYTGACLQVVFYVNYVTNLHTD